MHDLVIRGGTIVDGSGGELFTGDIAIDGATITQVGTVGARGREEIDASARSSPPASSTSTRIMMGRRPGIRRWRPRHGTASPPLSWAIAASASRPLRPIGTNG